MAIFMPGNAGDHVVEAKHTLRLQHVTRICGCGVRFWMSSALSTTLEKKRKNHERVGYTLVFYYLQAGVEFIALSLSRLQRLHDSLVCPKTPKQLSSLPPDATLTRSPHHQGVGIASKTVM
jgi:hypothetical protein